jgi:hypothetical protein
MSIVTTTLGWPIPTSYDVICDACGESLFADEELPPFTDPDEALQYADMKLRALVRFEDGQVRCFGCADDAQHGETWTEAGGCDGSGDVSWNPSRIGDPQCELNAPCHGCINCEFMDGSVDANGEVPA